MLPADVKQYFILHKALLECKAARFNQAMLDKKDTARQLMIRLTKAYSAWIEAAPPGEVRTYALFGRRCEELSGRRCTPQAVHSWFKTGRVDKSWLPIIEKVLGASLGFGHGDQLEFDHMGHSREIDARLAWPFAAITRDEVLALSETQRRRLETTMRTRIDELLEDAGNRRGRASRAAGA